MNFLALLSFLALLGCSGAGEQKPPPDLIVTAIKDWPLVELVPGQRLDFRTPVAFGEGRQWIVASQDNDAVKFEESSGLYGDDVGPEVPKGFELQRLIFLARKSGTTIFELRYRRPHEAAGLAREIRFLRIKVS